MGLSGAGTARRRAGVHRRLHLMTVVQVGLSFTGLFFILVAFAAPGWQTRKETSYGVYGVARTTLASEPWPRPEGSFRLVALADPTHALPVNVTVSQGGWYELSSASPALGGVQPALWELCNAEQECAELQAWQYIPPSAATGFELQGGLWEGCVQLSHEHMERKNLRLHARVCFDLGDLCREALGEHSSTGAAQGLGAADPYSLLAPARNDCAHLKRAVGLGVVACLFGLVIGAAGILSLLRSLGRHELWDLVEYAAVLMEFVFGVSAVGVYPAWDSVSRVLTDFEAVSVHNARYRSAYINQGASFGYSKVLTILGLLLHILGAALLFLSRRYLRLTRPEARYHRVIADDVRAASSTVGAGTSAGVGVGVGAAGGGARGTGPRPVRGEADVDLQWDESDWTMLVTSANTSYEDSDDEALLEM